MLAMLAAIIVTGFAVVMILATTGGGHSHGSKALTSVRG